MHYHLHNILDIVYFTLKTVPESMKNKKKPEKNAKFFLFPPTKHYCNIFINFQNPSPNPRKRKIAGKKPRKNDEKKEEKKTLQPCFTIQPRSPNFRKHAKKIQSLDFPFIHFFIFSLIYIRALINFPFIRV
jgi:hypothetical protein